MTTEQLKNWIKTQDADYTGRIRLGGVDANALHFLGVCPGAAVRQPMAIGGSGCTSYGVFAARLILRWGKSQSEAERKARNLWGLFYSLTDTEMDGAKIAFADPGTDPIPLGRTADGVFEYAINLTIYFRKE